MAAYRLSEPARADLFGLARRRPSVSSTSSRPSCAVAEMPGKGHLRQDLTDEPGLLFWSVGCDLIVYRAESSPLEVVRIVHGSRDAWRDPKPQQARRRSRRL